MCVADCSIVSKMWCSGMVPEYLAFSGSASACSPKIQSSRLERCSMHEKVGGENKICEYESGK